MEYRPFGPTKQEVSVIGEGTWYIEQSQRDPAIAAIREGIDLGMNHVDTAELYGNGEAERIISKAIAGRRDEVFLVSKVQPGHASKKGTMTACDKSLSRLGTDHLDCYLLHWQSSYPLEETIGAFEQLKNDGKIRSWGVSNFGVDDMEAVLEIAGRGKLTCNQVLYHLRDRSIESSVIPWCAKHGVAVVAYSPYGHGDFPGPRTKEGQILAEIAKTHNATPRQIALSFLTRDPSVFAIPKGSTPEHVTENAGAGEIHLSKDEISGIDKAFPIGSSPGFPPW
jgi:diketogulonate reductase-like aldo/keto reductase